MHEIVADPVSEPNGDPAILAL